MSKRSVVAFTAALAAGAFAQDGASAFKVYGFADVNFSAYQMDNSFAKQFVGADTFSLALSHTNLYFDFKPNDHIKALVEVGLFSRPTYIKNTDASNPAVISVQGQALSDAQIKSRVTEQKLDALVPAGTPQTQIDAFKNANRSTVAATVDSLLQPKLTALRQANPSAALEDKHTISIERAQFDLLLNDQINLRIGKFITPAGVWNVDHASPVILTVRQPLQTTSTPLFPESQTGLMGFGSTSIGDQDLVYNGYITGGRIDGSSTLLDANDGAALNDLGDLAYGGHLGLKLDLLKSVQLGASYFNGAVNEKHNATELQIDLPDLLAGKATTQTVTSVYTTKEREWAVGGDAKIEVSNLLLQGEVNYRRRENEIASGSSDATGWYVLAAWSQPVSANVNVTPYAMYERVTSEETGSVSGSFNDVGLAGFHTVSFGVNASFYTNYHLKFEYMNLQLEKDAKTWALTKITAKDLNVGIWSSQIAVAF